MMRGARGKPRRPFFFAHGWPMALEQEDVDDLEEAIVTKAQKPAKVSTQAGSVEQHPLPDQIAADRYARAKLAADGGPFGGIRLGKIAPPGAVSKNNESD